MDKEGDDLAPLGSHLDANHFPLRKTGKNIDLASFNEFFKFNEGEIF